MVVGAPRKQVRREPKAGSVFVYERDDTAEVGQDWGLRHTIVGSHEFHSFGETVTIAGNTTAVGAFEWGTNSTFLLIYGWIDSNWTYTQAIEVVPWDGGPADLGSGPGEWSLELTDSILAFSNQRGTVQVFEHTGADSIAAYSKQTLLPMIDASCFGRALAILDDCVFATSPCAPGAGIYRNGATYVFKKDREGIYIRQQRTEEPTIDFETGHWVAADGEYVAVAAFDFDYPEYLPVRIFSAVAGELVQLRQGPSPTLAPTARTSCPPSNPPTSSPTTVCSMRLWRTCDDDEQCCLGRCSRARCRLFFLY